MLYPPIEPSYSTFLKRGLHRIYLEACGTEGGTPVLFLHGGPGSQTSPRSRRFFNPKRYRIVLFDQRGCGRSRPLGEIEENTTRHLIEDLEAIREALDIEQWLLFGGSWGATLALRYAQTYPQRVLGMILRGTFLARERDWQWFIHEGPPRFFPDLFHRLAPLIVDRQMAYRILQSQDRKRALEIARAWFLWESVVVQRAIPEKIVFPEEERLLARAKIAYHYAAHHFFLEDHPILKNCARIRHLPVVLIHGRKDLICPLESSFLLYERLPRARLEIVEGAGHIAFEPEMAQALVQATDRFAECLG